MATKKENKKVEKTIQEEEIRKTQEIIINETIINETIKESEQKEKIKKDSKKSLYGLIFVFINVILVIILGFTTFNKDGNDQGSSFQTTLDIWFQKENVGYWIIALVLGLVAVLAEAIKFYIMINKTTGKHRPYLSLKTAILGKYYDNITPLGGGGQPFQIYYLTKGGVPGAESMYLPVASFFMNRLAFLILCITAFIFSAIKGGVVPNTATGTTLLIMSYVGAAFSIFLPAAIFIASFLPKLRAKIIKLCVRVSFKFKLVKNKGAATRKANKLVNDYRKSLFMLARSKGTVILVTILSFVYEMSLCSIPYFVVRACGATADWFTLMCTCVIGYSAISFIPTPGNSGAAELAFTLLFTGIAASTKYWAMTYWRFCCYFLIVIIGMGFVIGGMIKARHERKKHIDETSNLK